MFERGGRGEKPRDRCRREGIEFRGERTSTYATQREQLEDGKGAAVEDRARVEGRPREPERELELLERAERLERGVERAQDGLRVREVLVARAGVGVPADGELAEEIDPLAVGQRLSALRRRNGGTEGLKRSARRLGRKGRMEQSMSI